MSGPASSVMMSGDQDAAMARILMAGLLVTEYRSSSSVTSRTMGLSPTHVTPCTRVTLSPVYLDTLLSPLSARGQT